MFYVIYAAAAAAAREFTYCRYLSHMILVDTHSEAEVGSYLPAP